MPLAGVSDWTVEKFSTYLAALDRAGREAITRLEAQKLDLQNRYSAARNAGQQSTMDFLKPLIHRNSQLRMKAADYKSKYNFILNSVRGLLERAGLRVPPNLSGMGVLPIAPALILISGTLVTLAGVAWAIVREMNAGRTAIDGVLASQGPKLLEVARDPARTAEERRAALQAYNKLLDEAGARGDQTDWGKVIVPGLALVAVIVLGPQILRSVGARGARA